MVIAGIGGFQLQAARALRALAVAALHDGINVASVGAYRSYAAQVTLFLQRYTTVPQPGQRTEVFNGVRYWLKPGAAGAALPGTSNHGWGLASDMAIRLPSGQVVSLEVDPDSSGPATTLWDWLNIHGRTYGWSWGEAVSERWHWVYIEGDAIPAAVLKFENADPPKEDDMALSTQEAQSVWDAPKITSLLDGQQYPPALFIQHIHQDAITAVGTADQARIQATQANDAATKNTAIVTELTVAVRDLQTTMDAILAALHGGEINVAGTVHIVVPDS
jgi:hypothetical protein